MVRSMEGTRGRSRLEKFATAGVQPDDMSDSFLECSKKDGKVYTFQTFAEKSSPAQMGIVERNELVLGHLILKCKVVYAV